LETIDRVGKGKVSKWGQMSISDKNFLADGTSFSKHFIFTYKLCHDAMIYSQKFQLFIVRQVDAMQIVLKRNLTA